MVAYLFVPVAIHLVFLRLSTNEISLVQWLLALTLMMFPWVGYLRWRQLKRDALPIVAIISMMYWIYYALALFWGARTPSGVESFNERPVSDEALTSSLMMAVVGVLALWLGLRSGLAKKLVIKRIPRFVETSQAHHYVRTVLIIGSGLGTFERLPYMFGDGFRQIATIVVSLLPVLAFTLLFRAYLRGEASGLDRFLIAAFLVLRFVVGMSSGWLGSFAGIVVICGAMYVIERRKVPGFALALVVLFTLFFQVGKRDFREQYWQARDESSKIERVQFWADRSLEKWKNALSDDSGLELNEAMNASLSRLSLLTPTANVIERTPDEVPFQYGRLYTYMLITWIPRAVWPEKPSMNEANQFYQVAYGLTAEDALDKVAIAVGVLTESYISFGWYGVFGVMFLLGIFFDLYKRMFFSPDSGALMVCLGVALLPQMIAIESQMAGYLGGILQQVLLTIVVFFPVLRFDRKSKATDRRTSALGATHQAA
jgi:hypothetical protein